MSRTGVTIEGIPEALKAFNTLELELRRNFNGELRRASAAIARDMVSQLGGSGAPQEAKILAAAAPKSDRMVVLAVPNRKPSLSGMKRTPAGQSKALGWAIEAGSGAEQFHGPAKGSMVARHMPVIARQAVPRYQAVLADIMRRAGLI